MIDVAQELQRAIDAKKPGDTIKITYWRKDDSHTVDVQLATRPDLRNRMRMPSSKRSLPRLRRSPSR